MTDTHVFLLFYGWVYSLWQKNEKIKWNKYNNICVIMDQWNHGCVWMCLSLLFIYWHCYANAFFKMCAHSWEWYLIVIVPSKTKLKSFYSFRLQFPLILCCYYLKKKMPTSSYNRHLSLVLYPGSLTLHPPRSCL